MTIRKVNKESGEDGYEVLAEMLKEQLEKDDVWIMYDYIIVYFKHKYSFEKEFKNSCTLCEWDGDVECWINDFYEGQDEYILTGYTLCDELHNAEPIHKVKGEQDND